MRVEKRTNKNGHSYYSFVYYDSRTKKRVRYSKKEIQLRFGKDITTKAEAEKCLKLLEAEVDSEKERKKNALKWQKEYYSFNTLLDDFINLQKKDAPRSWKNSRHYMQYYVLVYFLEVIQCNNIMMWHKHYDDFKTWLEKDARKLSDPDEGIAYGSMNHAIKALNKFMENLWHRDIITKYKKLKPFPDYLLKEKDVNNIIPTHEFNAVRKYLEGNEDQEEADFLELLYETGMRFAEGLGISLADIYPKHAEIDGDIGLWLKKHNIKYEAFIVLQSQLDYRNIEEKGKTHRVPLKMKKKIGGKHGTRIIPITTKSLWKKLLERLSKQEELWRKSKKPKSKKSKFLLFDSERLTNSVARRTLISAYENSGHEYKSWHDCRHTRGTFLYGKTQSKELCKLWMGHVTERVFNKYIHVYEIMEREIRSGFGDDSFSWSNLANK